VTEIGSYAFDNAHGITKITIPKSVTRLGWYLRDDNGEYPWTVILL
jgi:hypothetical protein